MGVPECSVGKVKTMLGHGHTSPGSCEAPNWANEDAKFRHGLAILDLRHRDKKVRRSDSAPFVAFKVSTVNGASLCSLFLLANEPDLNWPSGPRARSSLPVAPSPSRGLSSLRQAAH